MSILLVCDDLLFGSKVTATSRAHGLVVATARTPAAAVTKAAGAACALIDLHLPELDLPKLLPALRDAGVSRVIGFGSHVDVEALKAARRAGCDQVMPRSQFSQELESRLAEWAAR